MSTEIRRVDPRIKRTRHLLQQALCELLTEKSFAGISVQDITDRARVNRATFYSHFEDKYILLDSIIREQFQQMLASELSPTSTWGEESLRTLIRAVLAYFRKIHSHYYSSDSLLNPLFERAAQRELVDLLLIWLKYAQAEKGSWQFPIPVETIALTTSWAIFGAAVQWSHVASHTPLEQMTEQILLAITRGVIDPSPHFLPDADEPYPNAKLA